MPEYTITYKTRERDSAQITRDADSYQNMIVEIIAEFEGTQCEILNIECTSVSIEGYYDWVENSAESSVLAAEVLSFFYRDEHNFIDLDSEVNGGDLVQLVAQIAAEQNISPQDYIREKEDKENAR